MLGAEILNGSASADLLNMIAFMAWVEEYPLTGDLFPLFAKISSS
jgi:hypothetical protein